MNDPIGSRATLSRWVLARLLLTALSFTSISLAFASTPEQAVRHWHLYYSPVMIAALSFGVKGALGGSAFAIIAVLSLYDRASTLALDSVMAYRRIAEIIGQPSFPADILNLNTVKAEELVRLFALPLEGVVDRAIILAGLGVLVLSALLVGWLVDNQQARERELVERARTDGLTGLANHRYFYERLREEVERSKRYGHSFALAMIDLDGLKSYNDTYGHLVGDSLLLSAADKIRSCLRKADLAARYGGDEFAAILLETDEEGAAQVTGRLLKSFGHSPVIGEEGGVSPSKVTVSIGLAIFPAHAGDELQLLQAADSALYQAKTQGGNRASVFKQPATTGQIATGQP